LNTAKASFQPREAMMDQKFIRCVFYRGGTSKGMFFHRRDLAVERRAIDEIMLAAIGSPDPYQRQLNGLGGGHADACDEGGEDDQRPREIPRETAVTLDGARSGWDPSAPFRPRRSRGLRVAGRGQ